MKAQTKIAIFVMAVVLLALIFGVSYYFWKIGSEEEVLGAPEEGNCCLPGETYTCAWKNPDNCKNDGGTFIEPCNSNNCGGSSSCSNCQQWDKTLKKCVNSNKGTSCKTGRFWEDSICYVCDGNAKCVTCGTAGGYCEPVGRFYEDSQCVFR